MRNRTKPKTKAPQAVVVNTKSRETTTTTTATASKGHDDSSPFPPDVLPLVFSFLDAKSLLQSRVVCRYWRRNAGKGCVYLGFNNNNHGNLSSPPEHFQKIGVSNNIITLIGQLGQVIDDGKTTKTAKKHVAKMAEKKRTKGHLPEPNCEVVPEHKLTMRCQDAEVVSNRVGCAMRVDKRAGQTNVFLSLDLSASTYQAAIQRGPHVVEMDAVLFGEGLLGKPRRLKNSLREADVSGLDHLQQLSVRGCGSLQALRLPLSLTALDASGCSRLEHISIPMAGASSEGCVLNAINVNGCRSLQTWPFIEQVMKDTRELDMCSVSQMPKAVIASALRATRALVTVSLRYVTTDQVLLSLAESVSAKSTLRMVDAAFSSELTDAAVNALVQSAPHLERLNLRGCSKVSAQYYNAIPILLQSRCSSSGITESDRLLLTEMNDSGRKKRRKGDNIFFFTAEKPSKRVGRKKCL